MEITNYTKGGICSSCGECCSDILPLSEKEVKEIKAYLKEHPHKGYTKRVTIDDIDLSCPFRNEMFKMCDIYKVRPEICKEFKCDQKIEHILKNKDLIHEKRRVHSLRYTFLNDTQNKEYARITDVFSEERKKK